MYKKDFILVAEDDIDDQQMLQTVFNEKQLDTPLRFVSNGRELLDYLEKVTESLENFRYPNFILLDLNMPMMDGRQALKQLKNHPLLKKIPVVVFSTTENKREISDCYELGANTYVVKPTTYSKLQKTLEVINSYWLTAAKVPITNP